MNSREIDKTYLKWIKEQPEWECIVTGQTPDACHLRSKGAGGSDYWVFPLKHELHIMMDHAPRGPLWPVKEHHLRTALAEWYYNLPATHRRYYNESNKQEALRQTATFGLDYE